MSTGDSYSYSYTGDHVCRYVRTLLEIQYRVPLPLHLTYPPPLVDCQLCFLTSPLFFRRPTRTADLNISHRWIIITTTINNNNITIAITFLTPLQSSRSQVSINIIVIINLLPSRPRYELTRVCSPMIYS